MNTPVPRAQMTPDSTVRRYLSLDAAVDILATRELRLTLVESFRERDPYEGTVPLTVQGHLDVLVGGYVQKHHQNQQFAPYADASFRELVRQPPRDLYREFSERRSAQRRASHASCWIMGPESVQMWERYGDEGGRCGVCLETTADALSRSVERHKLIVRPIFYRDYHIVDGHGFDDDPDLCFQKRTGYSDEREVRLLHFDSDHYHALLLPRPPAELPRHKRLAWEPLAVLERIILSPRGDEAFERAARETLQRAAGETPIGDWIELSVLDPRRHKPIP